MSSSGKKNDTKLALRSFFFSIPIWLAKSRIWNGNQEKSPTWFQTIPSSLKSDFAKTNWQIGLGWDTNEFAPLFERGSDKCIKSRVGLIKKALKSHVFRFVSPDLSPFVPRLERKLNGEAKFLGEQPVKWVLKSCKHMPKNPREATQYQSNFGGWGEIPYRVIQLALYGEQPRLG